MIKTRRYSDKLVKTPQISTPRRTMPYEQEELKGVNKIARQGAGCEACQVIPILRQNRLSKCTVMGHFVICIIVYLDHSNRS